MKILSMGTHLQKQSAATLNPTNHMSVDIHCFFFFYLYENANEKRPKV